MLGIGSYTFLKIIGLFVGAFWLGSRFSGRRQDRRVTGALDSHSPASSDAQERAEGLVGGKYQLVRLIGQGGMGEVFEANDQSLGRTVAIKKMSAHIASMGPAGRRLFATEARAVASVHHPAIVDIYDVLEEGREIFLIFEFVKGRTVEKLLEQLGRFNFFEARMICVPVCQALEYAHSHDLVHRDIKPANIMVTDAREVKLMDFGVARSVSANLSEENVPAKVEGTIRYAMTQGIVGTPAYMSPEAEQGVICKESDIYSLGACLYEMLTGEPPFSDSPNAQDKLNKAYVPVSVKAPGTPKLVDALISRALEPTPEARIRTAREFQAMLEGATVSK